MDTETISFQIGSERQERMENHPEINWSEVVRQAINEKIEAIEHPERVAEEDMSPVSNIRYDRDVSHRTSERDKQKTIEEKQQRERAELRADLEEKLSDGAIERLEIMDELHESGQLGEMIDSGDFSDLPDELRPQQEQGDGE